MLMRHYSGQQPVLGLLDVAEHPWLHLGGLHGHLRRPRYRYLRVLVRSELCHQVRRESVSRRRNILIRNSLTTLGAGLSMFKASLGAVLRSAVSFFDTTPMGTFFAICMQDPN